MPSDSNNDPIETWDGDVGEQLAKGMSPRCRKPEGSDLILCTRCGGPIKPAQPELKCPRCGLKQCQTSGD